MTEVSLALQLESLNLRTSQSNIELDLNASCEINPRFDPADPDRELLFRCPVSEGLTSEAHRAFRDLVELLEVNIRFGTGADSDALYLDLLNYTLSIHHPITLEPVEVRATGGNYEAIASLGPPCNDIGVFVEFDGGSSPESMQGYEIYCPELSENHALLVLHMTEERAVQLDRQPLVGKSNEIFVFDLSQASLEASFLDLGSSAGPHRLVGVREEGRESEVLYDQSYRHLPVASFGERISRNLSGHAIIGPSITQAQFEQAGSFVDSLGEGRGFLNYKLFSRWSLSATAQFSLPRALRVGEEDLSYAMTHLSVDTQFLSSRNYPEGRLRAGIGLGGTSFSSVSRSFMINANLLFFSVEMTQRIPWIGRVQTGLLVFSPASDGDARVYRGGLVVPTRIPFELWGLNLDAHLQFRQHGILVAGERRAAATSIFAGLGIRF